MPQLIIGSVIDDIPPKLRARARNQAGVVSRSQALSSGLTRGMINARIRFRRWSPIHPGVYATFTGPVSRDARLWAAALYAGSGAYLSHETAAEINKLTDDFSPVIHVTIPRSRRVRAPAELVIHRSAHKAMTWHPPEIPPYTIAEETVIDLVHAAAAEDDVVALITGGFNKRLLAEDLLRTLALTRKRLRWREDLDEIITLAAGGTHSLLEYRHDRDVQRAHGLPEPVKQAKFRKPDGSHGYRDRYYPHYGLVIELDGKRYHPDEQRDRDRERDNQAAVTGSTLRYGWEDVTSRPCETARQEAEALRHRGWTGTLKPCSPSCRAVTAGTARQPRRPA